MIYAPRRTAARRAAKKNTQRKEEVKGLGKGRCDDNRSNQLNPNNDAYWQSRDEDERPDDWEEQAEEDK